MSLHMGGLRSVVLVLALTAPWLVLAFGAAGSAPRNAAASLSQQAGGLPNQDGMKWLVLAPPVPGAVGFIRVEGVARAIRGTLQFGDQGHGALRAWQVVDFTQGAERRVEVADYGRLALDGFAIGGGRLWMLSTNAYCHNGLGASGAIVEGWASADDLVYSWGPTIRGLWVYALKWMERVVRAGAFEKRRPTANESRDLATKWDSAIADLLAKTLADRAQVVNDAENWRGLVEYDISTVCKLCATDESGGVLGVQFGRRRSEKQIVRGRVVDRRLQGLEVMVRDSGSEEFAAALDTISQMSGAARSALWYGRSVAVQRQLESLVNLPEGALEKCRASVSTWFGAESQGTIDSDPSEWTCAWHPSSGALTVHAMSYKGADVELVEASGQRGAELVLAYSLEVEPRWLGLTVLDENGWGLVPSVDNVRVVLVSMAWGGAWCRPTIVVGGAGTTFIDNQVATSSNSTEKGEIVLQLMDEDGRSLSGAKLTIQAYSSKGGMWHRGGRANLAGVLQLRRDFEKVPFDFLVDGGVVEGRTVRVYARCAGRGRVTWPLSAGFGELRVPVSVGIAELGELGYGISGRVIEVFVRTPGPEALQAERVIGSVGLKRMDRVSRLEVYLMQLPQSGDLGWRCRDEEGRVLASGEVAAL